MPSTDPTPLNTLARLRWLPLWILGVGLALTVALGFWSFQRESEQAREALEREAVDLSRALDVKVRGYLDTLPGLRVYGVLKQAPSDAEFLQYVQAISLQERYPGLALTFIAERVVDDERAAFEARTRADTSVHPAGHPGFGIVPPGRRDAYMVLRHVYPPDPPSFGYDLFDPGQNYRAAVQTALDSGRYVATGPLQLARDRGRPRDPALTSIVVRAALYRGGVTPATVAERRQRASGVVGIGFRIQPLMATVLPPRLAALLRVRVVDEQVAAAGGDGLLFDSLPAQPVDAGAPVWRGRIAVADRHWAVSVHRRNALTGQDSTWILLVFGTGLTLALAGMTRGLVRANLGAEARLQDAAQALLGERDQLRRSEARFRMLFEHSFDAVLSTTPDGRVLDANAAACRLFGGSADTLRTLGRGGLVDAGDERLLPLLAERERRGRITGQLRMRRVDGTAFEAELSSAIYADADGQRCTSLIVRDVTERERLAERLQERQRLEAIGTLAGGVAHDFNNMLAAILGNVALAEQEIAPDAKAQDRLRLVHRAAERARSLVRQILAFSRSAPREQAVQALQPLVDEAVALLRSTLPPQVRLRLQPADTPLLARVDGAQMQQVLLNLCTNAWQALPDAGGEVRVALQRVTLDDAQARALGLAPGDHACLRVDDDGHGMDEAVRARIFEPFFTTKPAGRGTGLGMAVVHGVVSASGGAIHVDSAPGRGTRVAVYLPLAADGAPPAATPAAAPPPAAHAATRVLYVDDDEVVALTAAALLGRAGCEVCCAGDGQAALQRLRDTPGAFDVVVTDFNMPGLSGLALAEAVHRPAPALSVIVISGHITDELQQRARQLGVVDVLPKEEMLERLVDAVRRAHAAAHA